MARSLFVITLDRVQATPGTPLLSVASAQLKLYLDAAGTQIADDLVDSTGASVTNGTFVIGNNSQTVVSGPPSAADVLYGRVDGGAPFPVYAVIRPSDVTAAQDVALRGVETTQVKHRQSLLKGVLRGIEFSRPVPGGAHRRNAGGAGAQRFAAGAGVNYPSTDGAGSVQASPFRYSRAPVVVAGGAFPLINFVQSAGLDSTFGSLPFVVEFHTNATSIDYLRLGGGPNTSAKAFIDGQPLTVAVNADLNVLPGPPSDGSFYYDQIELPSASGQRQRHVRLEFGGTTRFGGVTVPTGSTVTSCECAPGPKVIFLGDSFVEGTFGGEPAGSPYAGVPSGGLNANLGLAPLAGKLMGWNDTRPSGSGGTGYLNPGSVGAPNPPRKKFRDRVDTDVIAPNPDIVIVAGGINDAPYAAADVGTEAGLLFDRILSNLPLAALIVVGPFWPKETGALDANRIAINAAIKSAAESRGVWFIDPIGQNWITGDNKTVFTGADLTHPTVLGHLFYAEMIAANLQQMGH